MPKDSEKDGNGEGGELFYGQKYPFKVARGDGSEGKGA